MTHDKITDSEAVADAAIRLYNTTKTPKPPTRYLLPDWLGGHEVTLAEEADKLADWPNITVWADSGTGSPWLITIHKELLTAIVPSDEPRAGTVIQDADGCIWYRTPFDQDTTRVGIWASTNQNEHRQAAATWAELPRPIVELVPEPVNLIAAAKAWVDRITSDPKQWADEYDFALIAAVTELGLEGKRYE